VPAELSEPSFEVCLLVGDLHEPVGGSVRELAADGRGRWAFHELLWGAVRAPAFFQVDWLVT
jgi:hypothetical protein